MKHHRIISRRPELPQQAQSGTQIKANLVVGLVQRGIQYVFQKSSHSTL